MNQIWKYRLLELGQQKIKMPKGSKPVAVQTQAGSPMVWVMGETSNEKVERTLYVYGTGHNILEPDIDYVGTFQVADGQLVFHVFISKE